MPSVSKAQHRAMEAAAHGKSTLGIPKSVGKEFSDADKGRKFDEGGPVNTDKPEDTDPSFAAEEARDDAAYRTRKSVMHNEQGFNTSREGGPGFKGINTKKFVDGGPLSAACFEDGGEVGSVPTLATSSSYAPPPGKRKEGPRNYGKKW